MNKRGTETTGGQDVGRFEGRKVFRGSAVKRRRIGDGIGSQGRDEDIAKSPRKKVNVSSYYVDHRVFKKKSVDRTECRPSILRAPVMWIQSTHLHRQLYLLMGYF